jgi:MacB-like periplasmic core domain
VTIADSDYAAAHGLKVGSVVTIAGARFTVIGIVRQAPGSNAPELYIPMARAQPLARLPGQVNTIYVQAASAFNLVPTRRAAR